MKPTTPLPVLFFIHGGSFYEGSGKWFGPELLMNEDVILVTINYRLGPFGFLSLNTAEYSGNNGLKDQLMALRWVNENIHNFGGDKHKITIYGQDAGATSVSLHLHSTASKGLFQRAILSSGSDLNPWTFSAYSDHKTIINKLAGSSGTTITSDTDLITFLQSVDAKILTEKTFKPFYVSGTEMKSVELIWAPVVEGL